MTGSLPIIGVQAAVLGMAAFNSNSRTVEAQLAAMGVAAARLERSSSSSFDGVIGSLQNVSNAHKVAADKVIAAQAKQAEAINSVALVTKHAEESVVQASSTAAAAITAANARIVAAQAERSAASVRANDTIRAAIIKERDTALEANLAQMRSDVLMAANTQATADAVVASNQAQTTSFWKKDQAIRAADASAKTRTLETSVGIAPGQTVNRTAFSGQGAAIIQARKEEAAAHLLLAQAVALDDTAQQHLKTTNLEAAAAEKAHVASIKTLEKAELSNAASANTLANVRTRATEQQVAAIKKLEATELSAAAAITAAEAQEAAAYTAAGISITAAEAKSAAATQASADAKIAANAEVIASTKAMALMAGGALLGIAAGLAALGAAALTVGVKYEQALAFTGTLTESTSAQIKELSDAQLELSRRSTLSAGELNKISGELGKAGLSIKDILGGTLQATNDLVVASNGELKAADAAVLMQVAMAGFRKEGEDASTAAETAANSATAAVQRSSLTFTDFSVAMRQGGGAAANFGLTIKEFSAAIGVMGRTIASGSEAGTGFRMVLTRLQNPTKEATELLNQQRVSLYDAAGAARPLRDIISNLSDVYGDNAVAAGKMTQQQRDYDLAVIFGARGGKAAIALTRDGIKAYDDMLDAVNRLKASDLANQLLLPTGAQLKIIGNNITDIGIAFSEGLTPYVNKAVSSMLAWIQTVDLKKVTEFGELVGVTLYNAFANIGNILDAKITPNFSVLHAVATAALAAIAFSLLSALAPALVIMGSMFVTWAVAAAANIATVAVAMAVMAANAAVAAGTFIATAALPILSSIAGITLAIGVMALDAGIAIAAFIATAGLPLLLAIGAVAGAAALLVVAWENNWGDIQSVVNTAVTNMRNTLGGFFEWAFKGLDQILEESNAPRQEGDVRKKYGGVGVSEHRAKSNDPLSAFFTAVPKLASDAGKAVKDFIAQAKKDFDVVASFKLPESKDFAADVRKAWDASAEARDKALDKAKKVKLLPEENSTEPGSYPVKDDGNASKKIADALRAARELASEFNKRVTKETASAADQVGNLYEKAYDRVEKAITKAQKDVDKATADAVEKITELDNVQALRDNQDLRKKNLDKRLTDEKLAGDRSLAVLETVHKRTLEDTDRAYDKERQIRDRAFDEAAKSSQKFREQERQDEDKAYSQNQKVLVETLKDTQAVTEKALKDRYNTLEQALKAEDAVQDKKLKDDQRRESQALKDANENAKRDLKNLQDTQSRALKNQQEAATASLKLKLETEQTALKNQQEAQSQALKANLELEDEALKVSQNQREEALKKQLSTADLARTREQEAADAALKDKLAAEQAAFKDSQEQRENNLKKILDAEKQARDDQKALADINAKDALQRAEAQAEYSKEISLGVKQSIAQGRLDTKLTEITKTTTTAKTALTDKQTDRTSDDAFAASQLAKLDALKASFAQEDVARRDKLEADALAANYKREDARAVQRAANEAAINVLKAKFDVEDSARKLSSTNQEYALKEQHELQDIARKTEVARQELVLKGQLEAQSFSLEKAHSDQTIALDAVQDVILEAQRKSHEDAVFELNRKQTEDSQALRAKADKEITALKISQDEIADKYKAELEKAALERSQLRVLEDLRFQDNQERASRRNAEIEDEAALKRKRENEDVEYLRKISLEDDALKYHKEQTAERDRLDKEFEAEEYNRKITNINAIRDASIEETRKALEAEQALSRTKLAEDVLDLVDSLKLKTDAVQADYIEKLGDILEKGGPALQSKVDDITSGINASINSMTDVTKELTEELIKAFSAENALAKAQTDRANAKSNAKNDTPAPSVPSDLKPGAPAPAPASGVHTFDWGAYNFAKNTGDDDATARNKATAGKGAGPKIIGGDISAASQQAVDRATKNINSNAWNGWCAKFVANMFGKDAAGGDAWQVNARTITNQDRSAPKGSVVAFRRDPSNGNFGHIGISQGDGNFISATSTGVQVHNFNSEPYWAGLYQGWGPPKFKQGVTDFQGGLAYVHQGEMLVNLPKGTDVVTADTLAAVRAAEAGYQRGNSSNSQTTNHYQYSVEANYGRMQPEGSIRRDLSALVSMTRR